VPDKPVLYRILLIAAAISTVDMIVQNVAPTQHDYLQVHRGDYKKALETLRSTPDN